MSPIPPDSASQFEKMSEGSYGKVTPVIAGYYLGYDTTIPDSFLCRNEKLSSIIRYVAAQLLSVTLALKSPFLCVNRSLIRYGFRAGTKSY